MRYPSCAAWFASAALLISSGCASAQAPIIEAGGSYGASSSAPKSNPTPAVAEAQGSSGSLLLQLQALQQEVMELRGIVEEQNHQIETLKQQSLDRYLELDRRLSGSAAATGAATGAAVATGSAIDAAAPLTPPGAASGAAVQNGSAMPANGAAAENGAAAPAGEYEAYKQAYAKVKEQNFAAAVQSFNDFIKTYPSSTLTPNAYYWLGELYLQTPQDLQASEKAFSRVVKDYPQHSKAPDSLYKLGRVYFMKGDKTRAQETLQQVIDDYGASGSAAPQLAKQFLDQNYR